MEVELSNKAEVIQVIKTTLTLRGKGTDEDPIRQVVQYWSLTGELLAGLDPAIESIIIELMAKLVYNYIPYDGVGDKPVWITDGNSIRQEECRRAVRAALGVE